MMSTVALATVVTIALGLLRAILVSLMAGETKGAFAAYLRARVHKAASKLDPDLAIEQEQEWLEELAMLGDRPIRALLFARGLRLAARAIAADTRRQPTTAAEDESGAVQADQPATEPSAAVTPERPVRGLAPVQTPRPALAADALTAALRGRGMRVTPQRVVVHRALRELDRHVTADELLHAVTDRLPNISLPTVYATLELLEELGMVRRVQRDGTTLFDPRTEPHHHLVCTSCGSVEDLEVALDSSALERVAGTHGFRPERVEAVVRGRCAFCAASQTAA